MQSEGGLQLKLLLLQKQQLAFLIVYAAKAGQGISTVRQSPSTHLNGYAWLPFVRCRRRLDGLVAASCDEQWNWVFRKSLESTF